MATQAGVGYADNPDSEAAGHLAATTAMRNAGISACDVVLLFATGRHDPTTLVAAVRGVVGPTAALFGGSAAGIISNDDLGYDGYQVGVAVIRSDVISFETLVQTGLVGNEDAVGADLGRSIAAREMSPAAVVLLYDSLRSPPVNAPPVLNLATPLIAGLMRELSSPPPIAGAGLMGDFMFHYPTAQWIDDRIESQCAQALLLSGRVCMNTLILHGCRPASGYHTITRAEGNVVLEINGKPALGAISELLGNESAPAWEEFPLLVTLGVNRGDHFAPFREEDYANRLCFAVDSARQGLVMFEPDLAAGDEVQLMRRSIGFEYIGERIRQHLEASSAKPPFLALYIDCLGRAGAYSNTDREEAEEVQKHLGPDVPLLGFYSGVEIARIGDELQALDWTGVLCLFSEEDPEPSDRPALGVATGGSDKERA